jgi:hypothetical protein
MVESELAIVSISTRSALLADNTLPKILAVLIQVAVVPWLCNRYPAGPIGINAVVLVLLWIGIDPTLPPIILTISVGCEPV